VRARVHFAAHLARLAQGEHDLVGGLRHGDGLSEAGIRAAALRVGVRCLGVGEGAPLGEGCAGALLGDAVEHGHDVGVAAGAPPRTEHVVLVPGERANHRRLPGGIERQDPALVLEQDHRAARGVGAAASASDLSICASASAEKYGFSNRPARNGADLHRVVDRFMLIGAPRWRRRGRDGVLVISGRAGVQRQRRRQAVSAARVAAGSGPSAGRRGLATAVGRPPETVSPTRL
jgi:hypothetical protein